MNRHQTLLLKPHIKNVFLNKNVSSQIILLMIFEFEVQGCKRNLKDLKRITLFSERINRLRIADTQLDAEVIINGQGYN